MNHWDDDTRYQNAEAAADYAREHAAGAAWLLSHPCPKCGGRVSEWFSPVQLDGKSGWEEFHACETCEAEFDPTDYAYREDEEEEVSRVAA